MILFTFEGFYLGPVLVRWNGLLIAFAIAWGALLAALETKRRSADPELIYHLFVPVTMWGLIGARLWHVFTPPLSSVGLGLTTRYYLAHPLDILALWTGGYGIPGMFLGGMFGLFLFSRKYAISFWELTDLLVPGLALAMSIGRVGNFFNQELYGVPTSPFWGIFIQLPYRLKGYEQFEYYHPLFAYEAVPSLIFAGALFWIAYRFSESLWHGDLLLIYFMLYSLLRFTLEFIRLDVALIGGININQVFFGILFLVAGGILFWRHRPAQIL
jgi:phosphatidylglycerol---prolipoprotein diacylglyceryl transferase